MGLSSKAVSKILMVINITTEVNREERGVYMTDGENNVSRNNKSGEKESLHILGYARESTREQAEDGFNLDEQERRIKEYVNLYYDDANINFSMIREEGASAKSLLRPRMKEIIIQIQKGEIDIIIIHNLDRLTRNLNDMQTLLQLFSDYNVELVSLKESIDTNTAQGRFFVSTIVLIAQWEEETIGDRTVRGKKESARQGNYAKSRVPFGYYRDPNDKRHLLIDEEKAKIVRRIFQSLADRTHTPYTIAKELRKENVYERQWKDSGIEHIIKNRIYYGTFAWYGEEFDNHQPAIVSKELWEAANKNAYSKEFHRHNYLFKGLVYCEKCSQICEQRSTTKPSGTEYQYYVCPNCGAYINEKKILSSIGIDLNNLVKNHHLYLEVRSLKVKEQRIRGEMNTLINGYVRQRISKDYYLEMMNINACERKALLARIKNAESHIRKMTFMTIDDEERERLKEKYIDKISIDFEEKTALLKGSKTYERIIKYV